MNFGFTKYFYCKQLIICFIKYHHQTLIQYSFFTIDEFAWWQRLKEEIYKPEFNIFRDFNLKDNEILAEVSKFVLTLKGLGLDFGLLNSYYQIVLGRNILILVSHNNNDVISY